MRGPKPKSRAKHKKAGTYRKARHALAAAPADPIRKLPKAPTWLDKRATEKWKSAGAMLVKAGMLTELDLDALASYSQAWSTWREAIDSVSKAGQFVEGENGPKKHPAQQIAETAHKTMLALQERLGLLPLARQRLRPDAGGAEVDDLKEFVES